MFSLRRIYYCLILWRGSILRYKWSESWVDYPAGYTHPTKISARVNKFRVHCHGHGSDHSKYCDHCHERAHAWVKDMGSKKARGRHAHIRWRQGYVCEGRLKSLQKNFEARYDSWRLPTRVEPTKKEVSTKTCGGEVGDSGREEVHRVSRVSDGSNCLCMHRLQNIIIGYRTNPPILVTEGLIHLLRYLWTESFSAECAPRTSMCVTPGSTRPSRTGRSFLEKKSD